MIMADNYNTCMIAPIVNGYVDPMCIHMTRDWKWPYDENISVLPISADGYFTFGSLLVITSSEYATILGLTNPEHILKTMKGVDMVEILNQYDMSSAPLWEFTHDL